MSHISYLSELLASVFAREANTGEPADEGTFLQLCDSILSHEGESSGNRLARSLLLKFANATPDEQLEFFRLLASRFDINAEHAIRAAQRYADNRTAESLSILMDSVEPKRQELLRRMNRLPGATNELVHMRTLLLQVCRQEPDLQRIDVDFQHLFSSWFNPGFLVMREIDWHTPANILEKIIEYEAVHAISSWSELRQRLEPSDRRCFAFFHPAMLDEPLIFVEVALMVKSPESISEILLGEHAVVKDAEAKTAVFYSISNCQRGLAGVSFGHFLIKQVASELSVAVPSLETFRTLSPVPGFSRWLNQKTSDTDMTAEPDESASGPPVPWLQLARQVTGERTFEFTDEQRQTIQKTLAYYLIRERRSDNQPVDPVARFHLGNGASLDQVLPCADVSEKGLSQSAGVMVSYLYDLDKVATNHELYANQQQVFASDKVMDLVKAEKRKRNVA